MQFRFTSNVLRSCLVMTLFLPALASAQAKPAAKPAAAAVAPVKKLTKAELKEQARQADISRHLRMAQLLLDAGDHVYAQGSAREVLKLDKKHVDARRILAAGYARAKDWPKALEVLAELDKDVPNDLWVAKLRADIQVASGDKVKALAAYEALAALPGAPPVAAYAAAELLDEQRRGGDATVTERQKKHLEAYLKSPNAMNTPQGKQAERMLMEIVHGEIGKTFWFAREAYYEAFRTGGGISALKIRFAQDGMKKVLTLAPNLQDAHAYLGMCYASVKSPDYDLAAAERELKLAPNQHEATFALGRIYRESERLPEAAAAFQRTLQLRSDHAEAAYQLGVVYKIMGKRDEAVRVFEKVITLATQSAAATKAMSELQLLAPTSPVVARYGNRVDTPSDLELFQTERYKASILFIEKQFLGSVDEGPEVVWLEKMLRRIVDANDLPERVPFRVKFSKHRMVNAFATPHGHIYFTKGFLDHIAKRWPATPMDENNPYVAGVMAHEITHVIKGHIVNRELFRKSMAQAGQEMDVALFKLATRLNEIEADRDGLLYALAAGYNPNAMVEWMEAAALDLGDPPPMEDHPTFDERVTFLLDFWTNDVRFAWQAFESGTAALLEAQKGENRDLVSARAKYEMAAGELDRFTRFFRGSKEAWNNLAIAQAKLGVIEQGETSPLSKWYTPMSIEKTLALKLPAVKRKKRSGKDEVFLARAKESLRKALELDPKYSTAMVNLAAVHVGLKENAEAEKVLAQAKAAGADPIIVATLSGVLAAEAVKWDAAIAAFQSAADGSKDARALYCLALAKLQKGDKAGAKVAYQEFLSKEEKFSPWAALAERSMSGIATP